MLPLLLGSGKHQHAFSRAHPTRQRSRRQTGRFAELVGKKRKWRVFAENSPFAFLPLDLLSREVKGIIDDDDAATLGFREDPALNLAGDAGFHGAVLHGGTGDHRGDDVAGAGDGELNIDLAGKGFVLLQFHLVAVGQLTAMLAHDAADDLFVQRTGDGGRQRDNLWELIVFLAQVAGALTVAGSAATAAAAAPCGANICHTDAALGDATAATTRTAHPEPAEAFGRAELRALIQAADGVNGVASDGTLAAAPHAADLIGLKDIVKGAGRDTGVDGLFDLNILIIRRAFDGHALVFVGGILFASLALVALMLGGFGLIVAIPQPVRRLFLFFLLRLHQHLNEAILGAEPVKVQAIGVAGDIEHKQDKEDMRDRADRNIGHRRGVHREATANRSE